MATFVLVHGAWGGGWMYKGTAQALRRAGHEVYVPTLTGLGERSHLLHPGITLDTHVTDVVNLLFYEDLSDVILVGHSYGGMVISGVAAEVGAERLRSLVYVDAFLPEDGQALWDIADGQSQSFYVDGQRQSPGLVAPFFRLEERPGAASKVGKHPLLTLTQPVRYTGKEREIANRTYIYATVGVPTVFTKFHERVSNDPAWNVATIDTGHNVMGEDQDGFVELLQAEAER